MYQVISVKLLYILTAWVVQSSTLVQDISVGTEDASLIETIGKRLHQVSSLLLAVFFLSCISFYVPTICHIYFVFQNFCG